MAKPKPKLTIAIDTREQKPLDFSHMSDRVDVITATLPSFDYCLVLDNGKLDYKFALEHKSAEDLMSSFTTDHGFKAESKKIAKARDNFFHMAPIIYVVDMPESGIELKKLYKHRQKSVNPEYASTRLAKSIYELGISFCYMGNAMKSAHKIYKLLKQRKMHLDNDKLDECDEWF